ncbi:MAG: hypothetical protein EA423_04870 [Phycisphaerales bacterium]|nr:MAG: hypothetical protein EA423_04870 [Phycisphaerales bacterium]
MKPCIAIAAAALLLAGCGVRTHTLSIASPDRPDAAEAREARVSSLAWMAGTYRGTTPDTITHEETWAEPMGDAVVGMYHRVRGGRLLMSEILTIEERDGTLVLFLRHFSPGLTPWASEADGAMRRPLEFARENHVRFTDPESSWPQTVEYIREGDRFTIALDGESNGRERRVEFPLERVR